MNTTDIPSHAAFLNKCIPFLESIGIPILFGPITQPSFLPGLLIENGAIIIDKSQLAHPGDLLHEAGHIAVTPANKRSLLNPQSILNSDQRDTEEMMAIAWSYAAAVHLDIDAHLVFHPDGYHGGGASIVENFQAGRYFGTPMLQWCKMTIEPQHASPGQASYPTMLKWMRD